MAVGAVQGAQAKHGVCLLIAVWLDAQQLHDSCVVVCICIHSSLNQCRQVHARGNDAARAEQFYRAYIQAGGTPLVRVLPCS